MAIFNSPHPLLDNFRGNFKHHTFNCELAKCSVEDGVYHFHLTAEIDEENILDLIENGDASFAVKVENQPYFVKSWKADRGTPFEIKIEIPYESVSADLEFDFSPVIVTNKAFTYRNSNANPPMHEYNFNLSAHQIIGSHPSLKLSFERGYRKMAAGPLIKVVKLKSPLQPKAGTMDINLNDEDYIHVQISEANYERFRALNREEPKLLDALITLPVLQYALSELLYSSDLHEKGWAKILDEEYHVFEMKSQEDVLRKCDEMLKSAIPSFVDYFDRKYLDK
jgi:hypothetical protein